MKIMSDKKYNKLIKEVRGTALEQGFLVGYQFAQADQRGLGLILSRHNIQRDLDNILKEREGK